MTGNGSLITFLSDYGLDDGFVGVCHGVMARIAPRARIIDIAHGLRPYQVQTAALILKRSLPYFAVGIHVAVVDPGVGDTSRQALALRCRDGRILVGPDNGLLMPAADAGGGITEAVEIGDSPWRIESVPATFHGRDIFCPVAAHLTTGVELESAGRKLDPTSLIRREITKPKIEPGQIDALVLEIDRFGNLSLNLSLEDAYAAGFKLGDSLTIDLGGQPRVAAFERTFAHVEKGALVVFEDSFGFLAVAINRGDAARKLDASLGDEVKLHRYR